jgi:hypothetical protein
MLIPKEAKFEELTWYKKEKTHFYGKTYSSLALDLLLTLSKD